MFPYPLDPKPRFARVFARATTCFAAVFLTTLILVSTSGCGPQLSASNSTEITPGEIRSVLVDPVGRDQEIKVVASSSVPFNIHIYLAEDEAEVDMAVASRKESEKILAGQLGVTSATLNAQIPANKEAAIRLECAGPDAGSVSYSIEN